MGVSHYPRLGQRIAPVTLHDVLSVPVPDNLLPADCPQPLMLCDLDQTSWTRWDARVCYRLADAVVDHVRRSVASLPWQVRERRMPAPPEAMDLEALDLEVRTRHCLQKRRLLERPKELASQTVGDMLAIRNFGAKSLVDLLTALESPVPLHDEERRSRRARAEVSLADLRSSLESTGAICSHLRKLLQVDIGMLRQVESAESIRRDDPRLGHLLRAVDLNAGTVKQICESLSARALDVERLREQVRKLSKDIDAASRTSLQLEALHGKVQEFLENIRRCSRMTLEQELSDLIAGSPIREAKRRSFQIVEKRLGLDGCGGQTLDALADEYGITRERVRQVCERALKHLVRKASPFAPVLDRALDLIALRLPCAADSIEEALVAEGVCARPFRLEGILSVAPIVGRRLDFAVTDFSGTRLAVSPSQHRLPQQILQVARRSIQAHGAASIEDVVAQVQARTHQRAPIEFALSVLEARQDYCWLERTTGWFWLSALPRNRLLNNIRKILAVAGSIHVSELRAGVARHHRAHGFAPPRRVLLELCGQADGFTVTDNTVIAEPPLDWKNILGSTERTMVQVLLDHGPVIERTEFERVCLQAGMNHHTFSVVISQSPVLTRLAESVYCLRGAQVAPGTVELAARGRKSGTVLLDYGWMPDGKVWIGYRLSRGMISQGYFTVPAAMRRFVEGAFDLRTDDGTHFGTLSLSTTDRRASTPTGLRPFFRRRGGEPGDIAVILFDLSSRQALIRIGDPSLLGEFETTHPDAVRDDRTAN